MNKTRILTALTCILLLAAAASFAHEVHEKHKIVLKLDAGDGLLELDLSGLEVGESKQLLTDDGKEVVVTRQEDGYKIDVDGKELHVASFAHDYTFDDAKAKVFISEGGDVVKLKGAGHHVWISDDCEDCEVHKIVIGEGGEGEHVWISADEESVGDVRKIMIRRLGEGEGEHEMEVHVIGGHDGEGLHMITSDAEGHSGHHALRSFAVKAESAADRLAESGLLDELDEESREKILDFLREGEPKVVRVKVVVAGDDEEEEDE